VADLDPKRHNRIQDEVAALHKRIRQELKKQPAYARAKRKALITSAMILTVNPAGLGFGAILRSVLLIPASFWAAVIIGVALLSKWEKPEREELRRVSDRMIEQFRNQLLGVDGGT